MAFKHSSDSDTIDAGKFEIVGTIIRETEKAILLDDGTGEAEWLPKSKIRIERKSGSNQAAVFLPEWLAKKNGYVR